MIFKFAGRMPTQNEYIRAERGNKYAAAEMKKTWTEAVAWTAREQIAKGLQTGIKRASIEFVWRVKNERTDPDNICFAKKFVLDGLVMAGVLVNDGFKNIAGLSDNFVVDTDEGVEAKITVWEGKI